MVAGFRAPSPQNVYLPVLTGEVISFIKKEDEFSLNKWVRNIESPKMYGAYKYLAVDQSVRVPSVDLYDWPDASKRPVDETNKQFFKDIEFVTRRKNYSATLGYLELEQADWNIRLNHLDLCISQAMTARTQRVVNLAETVAGWGANVGTANSLNGGFGNWANASDDPASPKYNAIFKTLNQVRRNIHLATNGKVKPHQLVCVVGPDDAKIISQTAEMNNYLRQQEHSKIILEDGLSEQEELFGLPERYKGFKFVVEDATIVTEQISGSSASPTVITEATTNRTYVKPQGTAYVVSRMGALEGQYGARDFSTLHNYYHGALLEVEAYDHPEDRFVNLHATENMIEVLAAPVSGFLIQAIS